MTLRLGDTLIAGSGANQDLSNLTSTGQNIANWSSNVTNCITEIPQDIKLELNNGTLTLKSGSKVYVPNGFESDGTTPKFDVINITSDISTNYAGYPDYDNIFICLKTDGSFATYFKAGNQNSSSSGAAYSFTYRTDLNKIYDYEESTTNPYEQISFPIGRFKYQNNSIAMVYQVFNGFGYIGSTVFALPGVKGLIPDGRNADGSLKNIEFSYTSVKTLSTVSASGDFEIYSASNVLAQTASVSYYENENFNTDVSGEQALACKSINISTDSSGRVTSFTPKTTFHALDYNDSSTISGWGMPSSRYIDLTLLASGSTYTAPANGCFAVSKIAGQRFYYVSMYYTTGELVDFREAYETSPCTCSLSVRKGQVIKIDYNATGTTNFFRFTYAEGEN